MIEFHCLCIGGPIWMRESCSSKKIKKLRVSVIHPAHLFSFVPTFPGLGIPAPTWFALSQKIGILNPSSTWILSLLLNTSFNVNPGWQYIVTWIRFSGFQTSPKKCIESRLLYPFLFSSCLCTFCFLFLRFEDHSVWRTHILLHWAVCFFVYITVRSVKWSV